MSHRKADNARFQTPPAAPVHVERERLVAKNDYVAVYLDDVSFVGGATGTHFRIVEPKEGAIVVVQDDASRLYFHEVFRYAINAYSWEFIRGFGDSEDEGAKATALRELSEEAPFELQVTEPPRLIGYVRPNTTLLASRVPVFLIRVSVGAEKEETSSPEKPRNVAWMSSDAAIDLVAEGTIDCGFTLAALTLLRATDR